ncbi:hypothetical protein RHOSPDRAFT_13615, partial [Rhodotorula sp. JG-1b]
TAASTSTSTTSTILNHTYAPFYACYLLKSYNPKRLNQTYIGSTPDPPRRWRQHMGETVGGAFKTRLARPWEMEAIVYGFPTKLQALQFEWAWQNPHASRLLHAVPFPRTAASNRGQTRIQVLQYMLTVPPWRSFNLRVMLFSDLARTWWDRAKLAGPTDHLSFFLCTSASSHASTSDAGTNPCTALFHPSCLSAHFLSSTSSGPNRRPPVSAAAAAIRTAAPPAVLAPPLLPTHGNCPACDAELHWTDLVR